MDLIGESEEGQSSAGRQPLFTTNLLADHFHLSQ